MSVADFFDPPELFPGPTWTRYGEPVDVLEINSIAGPEHCEWQSAVMMHLGWPLGTVSSSGEDWRPCARRAQSRRGGQAQRGTPAVPAH